jgi:N-acetylglucosaminyldiphosphoundecaprenol N-acetyl-beta-D-mannosaminyltransferase
MLEVCALAAERGWRSFFYGGAAGVPELLARRLAQRFPGLPVAGYHSPPFRPLTEQEDLEIVERINSSDATLVWIGLSTPKQERWMAAHVDRLKPPVVLVGVGAAFDVHSGLKRDAPGWMGPLGLQWLYRLSREPRRLMRRYATNNPRFALQIIRRPPVLRAWGLQTESRKATGHAAAASYPEAYGPD